MAKHSDPDKGTKIRLPNDVADAFRALGPDWEERIVEALRAHLKAGDQPSLTDRLAEAVAPLRDHPLAPHVEKAAKDFASKVAKDVAAAAGAAALAAWTAGLARKDDDKDKDKKG